MRIQEVSLNEIQSIIPQATKLDIRFPKSAIYYAAYDDETNELMGVSAIQPSPVMPELKSAFVLPDHRRKKVYENMIAHQVKILKEKGIRKVFGVCTNMSYPLWIRLGGKPIRQYKKFTKVLLHI